ncbi:hypothetical protein ACWN6Y_05605 [Vagococcus teuberi]|uniref:Uncharacterized protein n=2 Tax=Vagococcus TaxID=2737 RepID=A0A1J0A526_9ENTE|nr:MULTISPECIES: hypothetical protein [Vagococcus]APB31035.1 hypothetical protein BHY08_03835 [Vagococcus teuberi]OPF88497.1 hypothetical protein BW731_10085 [Vagococcus martis]RHH66536.1 hypothetical protein DW196_10735 [Vagococcus sp. AM17-17]
MKHLKTIGFSIIVIWIIALFITYTPSFFWFAYLFISALAMLLACTLIIYLNPDIYYDITKFFSNIFRQSVTDYINDNDDDNEDDYYIVPSKRKKRKKRKKKKHYDVTSLRQRKDTHSDFMIINTSSANIRHKEYLHTTIPEIIKPEKQQILFETILKLKEDRFFSSLYAGLTEDDLINNYNEYRYRKIYELYDNIIPNTYAKMLYDPKSHTNRLSIFIPNKTNQDSDFNLGFISIEDSYKSDILINKYTNIQVIPTILGGTYKEVYKDDENNIRVKTDFTPYELTVSLAFYNI